MRVLGISAYYHDSAAALIEDGVIRAAAQEERFTRKKNDASFPEHSIRFVLESSQIKAHEIDWICFYDKPILKFDRLLETYLENAPFGFSNFKASFPLWIKEKLFQKLLLQRELKKFGISNDKLLFSEHHLSHAASAFYPSPFSEAAILTVDGVGEWSTTSVGMGLGSAVELTREILFPHSLGLLYSAFTAYLGFKVNSGEYKVMGLAPYGEPKFTKTILSHLIHLREDGSFELAMEYFGFSKSMSMTNEKFHALFREPPRLPHEPIEKIHRDLAASIQEVLGIAMLGLAKSVKQETKAINLCMAGGVALNCVVNSKLLAESGFERIWVQPAAGDAGGAIGAAFLAYYAISGAKREVSQGDRMRGARLGPEYPEASQKLRNLGAKFETFSEPELMNQVAEDLSAGKAIGWFQGRMEFGPRSLGSRSILADPRSTEMQSILNQKIKFRESFRPFAPAVLEEEAHEWFEIPEGHESPYMLFVSGVSPSKRLSTQTQALGFEKLKQKRSQIPAVTHVDYSARVQTVSKTVDPKFHALISSFNAKTGCPVIVNTSFNVRGEPIVCSPEDAFRCFMETGLEVLVVGNCYLKKETQDPTLRKNYATQLAPD